MTHHVNLIKMIVLVIGFPFRWHALHILYTYTVPCVRYIVVSFRCDDVIILQFDWTFLILGHGGKRSKPPACNNIISYTIREI